MSPARLPRNRNTQYLGRHYRSRAGEATTQDPTSPIKDANGNFILESSYAALGINPIAQETNGLNDNTGISVTGTGILTYKIFNGLTFTSNNTYAQQFECQPAALWTGPSYYLGNSTNGYALWNSTYGHSYQNSNYFTYHHTWGIHDLTVTALYEQSSGYSLQQPKQGYQSLQL